MRMWMYHGTGVNRPDRIAIRSGSKNSGKVWKSSKFVASTFHSLLHAEDYT